MNSSGVGKQAVYSYEDGLLCWCDISSLSVVLTKAKTIPVGVVRYSKGKLSVKSKREGEWLFIVFYLSYVSV